MPKKVAHIFSNIFCKRSKETLVTDAAPIPNESDEPNSNESLPHTREIGVIESHNRDNSPIQHFSETMVTEPIIDLVRNDNRLSEPENINHSLSVSNTQGYNVYQFSQINGLHIGSVFNITNTSDATDKRPKHGETIKKTRTIDAMMKSEEALTHKTMNVIATHLGEGWRDVIRHLGFSDGQIEQIFEENYVKGIKEVIYLFLLDYSRNIENASLGHIARILWKNGHKETVYILKEFWKNPDGSSNNDEIIS